ncbi:uncharacterized protein METZ01_LOCUS277866, partial [marine metagenome]
MTGVENIKTTVGKDDALTPRSRNFNRRCKLFSRHLALIERLARVNFI